MAKNPGANGRYCIWIVCIGNLHAFELAHIAGNTMPRNNPNLVREHVTLGKPNLKDQQSKSRFGFTQ
jgi:hypothetical protein